MGAFSQNFTSSSPVLLLPPELPPQPSFSMDNDRPPLNSQSSFQNGANPSNSPPRPSWRGQRPVSPSRPSTAGRKRSRDEAAPNLYDDEYFPIQNLPATEENEEEWEYGEGMTLVKPNGNYIISASSQTGTWAEARVEAEAASPAPSPERPPMRSHKSQRLDLTASPGKVEEFSTSNGLITMPLSASQNGLSSSNGTTEPTVDDFTRHLGIGWSSISADSDIQAAARGWTKFIENHYPVTDAKIRLQSRGLASYLVEAREGYFLFGEDLKQGRLVSTTLERMWENLRGSVPIFDGENVMEAGETPKVVSGAIEGLMNGHNNGLVSNGMDGEFVKSQETGQGMEVEMDMS